MSELPPPDRSPRRKQRTAEEIDEEASSEAPSGLSGAVAAAQEHYGNGIVGRALDGALDGLGQSIAGDIGAQVMGMISAPRSNTEMQALLRASPSEQASAVAPSEPHLPAELDAAWIAQWMDEDIDGEEVLAEDEGVAQATGAAGAGGPSESSGDADFEAAGLAGAPVEQTSAVSSTTSPSADEAEGGLGAALREVLGTVADAAADGGLLALVRTVSPTFAQLLEHGIAGVAEELLGDALDAFLGTLLDGLDPTALITQLTDEVTGLFGLIEGVLAGDPCCCETFDRWMQTLSDLLVALVDNPVANLVRDGMSAVGGVVSDLMALVAGAQLEVLLSMVGGAKAAFDGYLALVGAGQDLVKDLGDWVWDGIFRRGGAR